MSTWEKLLIAYVGFVLAGLLAAWFASRMGPVMTGLDPKPEGKEER